jgi:hypothetical protein
LAAAAVGVRIQAALPATAAAVFLSRSRRSNRRFLTRWILHPPSTAGTGHRDARILPGVAYEGLVSKEGTRDPVVGSLAYPNARPQAPSFALANHHNI